MDKFRNSKLNVDLLNEQLTGLNTDQEIAPKIKDQLYDQPKKIEWLFQESANSIIFDGFGSLFPDQDKTYYLELQDEGISLYYRTVRPLKLISEDSNNCLMNITNLIDILKYSKKF